MRMRMRRRVSRESRFSRGGKNFSRLIMAMLFGHEFMTGLDEWIAFSMFLFVSLRTRDRTGWLVWKKGILPLL